MSLRVVVFHCCLRSHLCYTSQDFDYDETAETDDESGYRFGSHTFRPGEYASIRDNAGEMRTYLVVSVEPAT
jgi:hypothetical protein